MKESTQVRLLAVGSGVVIAGLFTGLFFLLHVLYVSLILRILFAVGIIFSLSVFFTDTKGDEEYYIGLALVSIALLLVAIPAYFLSVIPSRYNLPLVCGEIERFCFMATVFLFPLQAILLVHGFKYNELGDRSEERKEKMREKEQRESARQELKRLEAERIAYLEAEQKRLDAEQRRLDENRKKGRRRITWE